MSDLSAASFKELLLDEVVIVRDPRLVQNFDKYVSIYSSKSQSLQYWYISRHLLMWQLRRAAELVDRQTGPDRVSASQNFRNLRTMLLDVERQITILDADNLIPEINFSRSVSCNPLIDTRCGHFDILENWPSLDNCYWDSPIYTVLR